MDTAKTVILYAPSTVFLESEKIALDALTILRATAAQRSCRGDVKIYAEALTQQGRESLLFQGIHNLISLPEVTAGMCASCHTTLMKSALLALEFRIKGALPFIANLVRTVAAEDDPKILDQMYTTKQNEWLKEYEVG